MKSKEVILIAIFSSMVFLALLFGIPIGFLKINIAGVIVLIAKKYLSYSSLIIMLIISLFLNYLLFNSAAGLPIDQIAFFISAMTMLLVYIKTSKLWVSVIITTIEMTFLNYLIITPFYFFLSGTSAIPYLDLITNTEYIVSILAIYPLFNLIQWSLVAVLYSFYERKLSKGNKDESN